MELFELFFFYLQSEYLITPIQLWTPLFCDTILFTIDRKLDLASREIFDVTLCLWVLIRAHFSNNKNLINNMAKQPFDFHSEVHNTVSQIFHSPAKQATLYGLEICSGSFGNLVIYIVEKSQRMCFLQQYTYSICRNLSLFT